MHIDTSTRRKALISSLDVVFLTGLLSLSIAHGGLPAWVLGLYGSLVFLANYTHIRRLAIKAFGGEQRTHQPLP